MAQEDQAQTQLGYTEVYAPRDGMVSVRVARQGETVQAGGPIVTMLDLDHLWVQADVEETYIDQITFGQKLRDRLPSGNILEGTVFYKGVEADFATQRDVSRTKRDIKTFEIKVAIPNQNRRLFAGMTAYVLLPRPGERAPVAAFLDYARGRQDVPTASVGLALRNPMRKAYERD